jgi:hypothetical protein
VDGKNGEEGASGSKDDPMRSLQTAMERAEPGETVRISVLLYDGDPPVTPTNENAAEETHFWVTVAGE